MLVGRRVYATPGSGATREAALLTAAALIMPSVEIPHSRKKQDWDPAMSGEISGSRPQAAR